MGRHSDSSRSDSDSDDSSRKKARKADSADNSHRSSSSKSSKKEKDGKKDSKHHKSKKDKHSKKDSKSHKKSSKHSKKDRKRRRSHSRSSTDGSESDSDDSSTPRASSKAAAASSTAAAASTAASAASSSSKSSVVPLPSASSVARCLDLIETLLKHGGGDRAESLRQVQFLLFKLDAGSSVDVSCLPDPLVKHILNTMLREAGCKVRQDPVSGEQGWMSPWDIKRGRPVYKLLEVLGEAFAPKATAEIGPTMPGTAPAAASSAASQPLSPSLPSTSAASVATSSSGAADATPRVLGPAMPGAEDFERLADPDASAAAAAADEDTGDAGSFGPKMPSQMSAAELVAFDRLRASREHLSMVKDMESARGGRANGAGREEWMTALPAADSGMPSTALLAAMAASGDKEAMRGRGFATKSVTKVDQDAAWSMSPAERARKDAEKVAVRQAEQAVYNSTRAINGQMSDLLGGGASRASANSTAEAAQAANDRMMARYKQQQAAAADSLMAAHARASEAAAKSAKESSSGLFVWDREKEMGMRAVKGAAALKKEMQSAFTLGDNFAPAGS